MAAMITARCIYGCLPILVGETLAIGSVLLVDSLISGGGVTEDLALNQEVDGAQIFLKPLGYKGEP